MEIGLVKVSIRGGTYVGTGELYLMFELRCSRDALLSRASHESFSNLQLAVL